MTDYSNACVYKIVCKDTNVKEIYVGSTKNLRLRRNCHKSVCNNIKRPEYNYKVYKFIRDNGDWENWEVVKICDVKCLDRYELGKAEGEYIHNLNPTLNEKIAGRTKEQYYVDNKDNIIEWSKKYYKDNKKHIQEHGKKYRSENKDKLKKTNAIYALSHKEEKKIYDKKYREKNNDKIKAYMKAYRAKKKLTSLGYLLSSTESG